MKRYSIQYLRYVLRHKWYAFKACRAVGIPWRGVVHDLSKFSWAEWRPYSEWFYGPYGSIWLTLADEYKAASEVKYKAAVADFGAAWLHHIHCNPHHWQYWITPDNGEVLPMPREYILEMVADWLAAGLAQGHGNDVSPWYEKNKDKMTLHPDTRERVEELVRALGGTQQ
jgi:hypothetical protein